MSTEMKNLFMLTTKKRENKSILIFSIFFMAIFLSGSYSGKFFSLNNTDNRIRPNSENYKGGYTFFISLYDSAARNHKDSADKHTAENDDQTVDSDTTLTHPMKKAAINYFIW